MIDYFISYNAADVNWAEWISWTLEEQGFSVMVQAWDFLPGSNFVLEMQRAAASASRTIAVLSPDYLRSSFAKPEWAAAFVHDPEGLKRQLIPVMVRECSADGLLKAIVHINLIGLSEEGAKKNLLTGLQGKRAKPDQAPAFPGKGHHDDEKPTVPFPGNAPVGKAKSKSHPPMPCIRGVISDLDRTRFVKQAFENIRTYFESSLVEFNKHSAIDTEFTPVSATTFTAEVFVNGAGKARCKIWLGGSFGTNQISYYEGHDTGGNAFNEALTLGNSEYELSLSAMMKFGFGMGEAIKDLDLNKLSPEEAAEYLWQRFIAKLS